MLKISSVRARGRTNLLRLEGRVVGPWVGELSQICEPVVNKGDKLALDLAELSYADESGVALLSRLKLQGVKLLNTNPFVAEQLKVGN
jgi:ABC-type transporter Mla MlaB component